MDPSELQEIEIKGPEDMLVFSIVTIPEDSSRMTANLQGPLLINRRTSVGTPVHQPNPRWGVRHAILEELALARRGA